MSSFDLCGHLDFTEDQIGSSGSYWNAMLSRVRNYFVLVSVRSSAELTPFWCDSRLTHFYHTLDQTLKIAGRHWALSDAENVWFPSSSHLLNPKCRSALFVAKVFFVGRQIFQMNDCDMRVRMGSLFSFGLRLIWSCDGWSLLLMFLAFRLMTRSFRKNKSDRIYLNLQMFAYLLSKFAGHNEMKVKVVE